MPCPCPLRCSCARVALQRLGLVLRHPHGKFFRWSIASGAAEAAARVVQMAQQAGVLPGAGPLPASARPPPRPREERRPSGPALGEPGYLGRAVRKKFGGKFYAGAGPAATPRYCTCQPPAGPAAAAAPTASPPPCASPPASPHPATALASFCPAAGRVVGRPMAGSWFTMRIQTSERRRSEAAAGAACVHACRQARGTPMGRTCTCLDAHACSTRHACNCLAAAGSMSSWMSCAASWCPRRPRRRPGTSRPPRPTCTRRLWRPTGVAWAAGARRGGWWRRGLTASACSGKPRRLSLPSMCG